MAPTYAVPGLLPICVTFTHTHMKEGHSVNQGWHGSIRERLKHKAFDFTIISNRRF